jgi:hypothetical protein
VKLGVNIKNGNNPERVEFDNAKMLITSSSTPYQGVLNLFDLTPSFTWGYSYLTLSGL